MIKIWFVAVLYLCTYWSAQARLFSDRNRGRPAGMIRGVHDIVENWRSRISELFSSPRLDITPDDDMWAGFKKVQGRKFQNDDEESEHKKTFFDNYAAIAKHNDECEKGEQSFRLKLNKYADIPSAKFRKMMNGFRQDLVGKNRNVTTRSTLAKTRTTNLPTSVNWATKGYVTPVKDQGQCGSCWAFSTTGSLEGQHFNKTGQLVSLSEQNLVDCSTNKGNDGCNGGLMDSAFEYIEQNGGIDTEDSYPYKVVQGSCSYKPGNIGATLIGFQNIPSGDEKTLQGAVATVGPISVAIDASNMLFQFYESGIYNPLVCSSTKLDHGVLVVGYGTENNEDYWLVKNSWGTDWGDNGYVKIARNKKNKCGIATMASYPMV